MKYFYLLLALLGGNLSYSMLAQPFSGHGTKQSILFKRLSDGKILFSKNQEKLLIPASVTKIVTSSAAFHYFSPNHQFKTKIYYRGQRNSHSIKGDLIIVGDGDPLLTNEKLFQFAVDLKKFQIDQITGDLILDASIFDSEERDRSRKSSRRHSRNAYNAPLSAIGVNFNSYALTIAPGLKQGSSAIIGLDPYRIKGVELKNQIKTSNHSTKIQVDRTTTSSGAQLKATGRIKKKDPLKKIYRSVGDPLIFSSATFRSFLQSAGIQVLGENRWKKKPPDAQLIHTIDGFPLSHIVKGLNKYSNNYIADVLVKRIGHQYSGNPGSYSNGIAAISEYLKKEVGLKKSFKIANGSGLDPGNRLSAQHLVKILEINYLDFTKFPEYLSSFPASGIDGTLKDRLNQYSGLIRAKTGTLTQPVVVASISGYMWHPKHHMIAFAIIENGGSSGSPNLLDLRRLQDRAIGKIIESI